MPNRGSQSVREQNYKWLVATYGETCILNREHLPPHGGKLDIDEISYDPERFDDPDNLSLVCHSCNCWLRGQPEDVHRRIIENARAKRLQELTREKSVKTPAPSAEQVKIVRQLKTARKKSGIDVPLPDDSFKKVFDYMNGSPEMKANSRFFPSFAVFTWEWLIRHGPTEENELLNSGAFITGANQTTLKRYLLNFCSKVGPLSRTDNGGQWMIYFKNPAKAAGIKTGEVK
jgi:hypothetical protein